MRELNGEMNEKPGEEGKAVLGDASVNAVRSQAIQRGFKFDQDEVPQASTNR